MSRRFLVLLLTAMMASQLVPASARDGDTLQPIEISAPALETSPEDFLADPDFRAIESRVIEARNSGVPVAVRIVDMTQPATDMPFPVRKYAREDFSQPLPAERQAEIAAAWIDHESIETETNADDGFLLLVLVPQDRTQTLAIWWIGPNALPLNGLTETNILATHDAMNTQFAAGNMPNGVYLGISEFSYNVQFGVPEPLERTKIGEALHTAVMPLAIATTLAGLLVPLLAWRLARMNSDDHAIEHELSPWQAAALHGKRPDPDITAAMLLDAVHRGIITPGKDGSLRLSPEPGNDAVEALRAFADDQGIVPAAATMELEAITAPVRERILHELVAMGAMTSRVAVDRMWMGLAMGTAMFLAALALVPSVVSRSAFGACAIGVAVIGVAIGCWWLAHRSYTSPAGRALLQRWLASASPEQHHLFDTAVHLPLLTDQAGGPAVNHQTRLVRQLRGLGAG